MLAKSVREFFRMQQNEVKLAPLPIDPHLQQIVEAWKKNSTLIVKASPGSGKTTRLPWALARESEKKVAVLEPRRLAAKLAATRITEENNVTLGKEVGHHFRFEKNHDANTPLIFYTEGTFLRLLMDDPDAPSLGTVILDEFHERHLETDLALAALRGLQARRPELKIVLMSATLDSKLFSILPNAHILEIEARQYNVDIHYLPNQPSILDRPLETKVKRTLENLSQDSGDVLIFLPGMREMLRVKEHLSMVFGRVLLLHGDLSKEEQARALNHSTERKIILATNIAESSITIPGIKIVIDSGIQREAVYSPWTGLKSLEDRPITQSSAIQRAGRAGRTSDGHCFRLYSEQDFLSRGAFTGPEILRADLTDAYLLTKNFKGDFLWLTSPPPERWQKAQELCLRLGATDPNGKITQIGKGILALPVEVRLGRTLVAGKDLNIEQKRKLVHYIAEVIEKDRQGVLKRRLSAYLSKEGYKNFPWEECLLHGFIDQVAKYRRKQNDFIHYSGKTLKAHVSLKELVFDYYIVLDVTSRLEAITVLPIEEEWIYGLEPFPFHEEESIEVGEEIRLARETRLGSISMETVYLPLNWAKLNENLKEKILLQAEATLRKKWESWKESETFLKFHYWARVQGSEIEALDKSDSLRAYLDQSLNLNWHLLEEYFRHTLEEVLAVSSLERLLPSQINLGGKRDLPVHYPYGLDPYVEAPIQDFYGVKQTPTIMGGKAPLTLKLLGPHKRPIQVTRDIQGFWRKTYQEMKREWQREYPRHHWPERPEDAPPILLKRQLDKA